MKQKLLLISTCTILTIGISAHAVCKFPKVPATEPGEFGCVDPKGKASEPKPDTKPTESSAPTAETKKPEEKAESKATASDPTPKTSSPDATTPGFSQADVVRRQKYADELARERDWNRMKDRESLDIRMRQFQGNHQNMRVQINPPTATPYIVEPFRDPKFNVIGEIVSVPNGQLESFIAENPDYAYFSKGNFIGGTPLSPTLRQEAALENPSDNPIQDLENEAKLRAARLLEMQARQSEEQEAIEETTPDLFKQIGLSGQGGNAALTLNQTITADASVKNEKGEAKTPNPTAVLNATINNNVSEESAVAADNSWEDLLTNAVSRAKTWIFEDEKNASAKGQNPPQLQRSVNFANLKNTALA